MYIFGFVVLLFVFSYTLLLGGNEAQVLNIEGSVLGFAKCTEKKKIDSVLILSHLKSFLSLPPDERRCVERALVPLKEKRKRN